MIGPFLLSGMKQAGKLAGYWIERCQICSLAQIAFEAGQGRISCIRRSAMLERHDMVDGMGKRGVILM